MNAKSPAALRGAIDTIFANTPVSKIHIQSNSHKKSKKSGADKIELALAVLLVDLASCDQDFDPREYRVISTGLRRMFGTTPDQVKALVNQANLVLKNLRGVGRFANLLNQQLSDESKAVVFDIIEEIIAADGTEDGYETYLRNKFSKMLGMSDVGKTDPSEPQN